MSDAGTALAAALSASGPGRRESIERALEARLSAGPGDEAVSNALAELGGRDDELQESLLDEVRWHAREGSGASDMMLGAWGDHLLSVFERRGRALYERTVTLALSRIGEREGLLLKHALLATSVEGDRIALRRALLFDFEEAFTAWVIRG